MQRYFDKFPTITYNGYSVKNIMIRSKLLDRVYNKSEYYNSYELVNSVRADAAANEIYNDPYMSWLIYLSNNTIDPYYDWQLSQHEFDNFISKKYGSTANAQSTVAFWMNNWYDDPYHISINEYNNYSDRLKQYYEPIYSGNKVIEYKRKEIDWSINTNEVWEYTVQGNTIFDINQKLTIEDINGNRIANGQVMFSNTSLIRMNNVFGLVDGHDPTVSTSTISTPTLISNGSYSVTYTVSNGHYNVNSFYKIDNNNNSSYNGLYKAISTTNNSITLAYNTNPGISGTSCDITQELYIGYEINYQSDYPIITGSDTTSLNMQILSSKMIAQGISPEEKKYWSPITYYDIEDIKNTRNQTIRLMANTYAIKASLELKRLLNQ